MTDVIRRTRSVLWRTLWWLAIGIPLQAHAADAAPEKNARLPRF